MGPLQQPQITQGQGEILHLQGILEGRIAFENFVFIKKSLVERRFLGTSPGQGMEAVLDHLQPPYFHTIIDMDGIHGLFQLGEPLALLGQKGSYCKKTEKGKYKFMHIKGSKSKLPLKYNQISRGSP